MNKYLIPIDDGDDLYIESVSANDYTQAQDKLIEYFCENFDIEATNWNELLDQLVDRNIYLGNIYDIEEF